MKLIINIPDITYNATLERKQLAICNDNDIYEWIKNGTPLDSIRAEVKGKIVKRPWLDFKDRERDRNDAFLEVLDIIDKYMAESEEV